VLTSSWEFVGNADLRSVQSSELRTEDQQLRVKNWIPEPSLLRTHLLLLCVIASPMGAAISSFMRLLRRFTSRNDKLFTPFILIILLILTLILFIPPFPLLSQNDPATEWHLLYIKIRDSQTLKEDALTKLKSLEPLLKNHNIKSSNRKSEDRFGFPLKGYGPSAIGGKGGNGYQIEGYDFFDGNRHKGHPGHDIFVRDKNQDSLDDRTGKPIEVISVSSGMIVSINLNWEPSSPIRGGNYIWVYDPIKSRYYYYAHLNEIYVKVGQIVSKGERLGTVGRTGVKAYPKRSPTHLHFVVHHSVAGYPKPINPYSELIRATNY
jgi:murein DD-endopeptidase MepM/ murein hydrolase activator NlpD